MAVSLRIQIRGDTAESWESKNPVLLNREIGYDRTNNRLKVGDGLNTWTSLPFVAPDVINDLITGGSTVALSAEQGKALKALADTKADSSEINNLIQQVKDSIITVDIIDGLDSDRTDAALSANQGRELKALVDAKADSMEINEQIDEKLNADRVTHETWVFTLEDDSTVDKEVVLWSS